MSKDKLIKELQKYNQDLDKHLPRIDNALIKDRNIFNEEVDIKEDMLALLINTVNDLKIELALTRKDLANNIEGMALRMISKEQGAFLKHANDMNLKYFANIKETLGSYVTQLHSEFSKMRKEINELTVMSNKIEVALSNSNSSLVDVGISLRDLKSVKQSIEKSYESIDEKIERMEKEFKKSQQKAAIKIVHHKELEDIKPHVLEHKVEPKKIIPKVPVKPVKKNEELKVEIPVIEPVDKILLINERIKKLESLKINI